MQGEGGAGAVDSGEGVGRAKVGERRRERWESGWGGRERARGTRRGVDHVMGSHPRYRLAVG